MASHRVSRRRRRGSRLDSQIILKRVKQVTRSLGNCRAQGQVVGTRTPKQFAAGFFDGRGMLNNAGPREETIMATGRVPAIDLHAHTIMPEIEALVRDKQGWREDHEQRASFASAASAEHNRHLNETLYRPRFASLDNRL